VCFWFCRKVWLRAVQLKAFCLQGLENRPPARTVLDDPAVQGGVIHIDTTLLHDFLEIVIGNSIADVEKDGEKDQILLAKCSLMLPALRIVMFVLVPLADR